MNDLTPAEQAAAEALARHFNLNYSDGIERHGTTNWTPEARAVVAAVQPIAENDGAVKALTAAASDIETLIDAFSNTKGKNFSGAISGLERALSVVRRRSSRLAAQSLSRPTSEETQ